MIFIALRMQIIFKTVQIKGDIKIFVLQNFKIK